MWAAPESVKVPNPMYSPLSHASFSPSCRHTHTHTDTMAGAAAISVVSVFFLVVAIAGYFFAARSHPNRG